MKTIVLDGRDLDVRARVTGRVEFRYCEGDMWFSLDGFERAYSYRAESLDEGEVFLVGLCLFVALWLYLARRIRR